MMKQLQYGTRKQYSIGSIQLFTYLFFSIALLVIKKHLVQYGMWAVGCYEVIWDGPKTDHIDKTNLQ